MLQTTLTTLEHLLNQFGGALLIRPALSAPILGMARQTMYNQIGTNTFPIRLVQTSTGRKIKVHDLAEYIDSLQSIPIPIKKPLVKAPVGRPTKVAKVEQAEAKRLELSVREFRAQSKIDLSGGK